MRRKRRPILPIIVSIAPKARSHGSDCGRPVKANEELDPDEPLPFDEEDAFPALVVVVSVVPPPATPDVVVVVEPEVAVVVVVEEFPVVVVVVVVVPVPVDDTFVNSMVTV